MPITGRVSRDAVHSPSGYSGGRSYPFECLWDFISPLVARAPLEPINGVGQVPVIEHNNQLRDYFVGMIEP
jgi:hypothetical protein